MKTFTTLAANRKPIDLADYKMRSAQVGDYDTLVSGSTLVYEGDRLMIAYVELDMDCSELIWALNQIKYISDARTNGLPTTSRIIGYSPRVSLRKDFCSATSLAKEQPNLHKIVADYAVKVAEYYAQLNPELYGAHAAQTEDNVIGDFRIKDSPFTSGIINKNNPLKYHFDSGNFRDVWSAMLVFKHQIKGGYLAVPEYGLGFELKNNSLFLFDGQALLHGVTPIRRMTRDAQRYSIVYYSLREMWNCLPITDELLRIRRVKTEREQKRTTTRTREDITG